MARQPGSSAHLPQSPRCPGAAPAGPPRDGPQTPGGRVVQAKAPPAAGRGRHRRLRRGTGGRKSVVQHPVPIAHRRRKGAAGRAAAAAERLQQGTFQGRRRAGGRMVDGGQSGGGGTPPARLHRHRALPGSRRPTFRRQGHHAQIRERRPQSLQPGAGQEQGRNVALAAAPQTGRYVAAHGGDARLRRVVTQQRRAAWGTGAHRGAGPQSKGRRRLEPARGDSQHVARSRPRQYGGQTQSGRLLQGQVLERMNRCVRRTAAHRGGDFGGEQSRTGAGERSKRVPWRRAEVAAGGHRHDAARGNTLGRAQCRLHQARLRQRQGAAAGGEHQLGRRRAGGISHRLPRGAPSGRHLRCPRRAAGSASAPRAGSAPAGRRPRNAAPPSRN